MEYALDHQDMEIWNGKVMSEKLIGTYFEKLRVCVCVCVHVCLCVL